VAAKGTSKNGHSRLEDALATLIQTQATFVQTQAEFSARMADYERQHLELGRQMDARVNRIESRMIEVVRILTDHTRQLEKLTDAVRDKIGFKP